MLNQEATGFKFDSTPNAPDTYVGQDESQMLKVLLNKDDVQPAIKLRWWTVFSDDVTLGFLDDERKWDKLLAFHIICHLRTFSRPYGDVVWKDKLEQMTVRQALDFRLDRARGATKPALLNERSAQISQFSELRHISEAKNDSVGGHGFLGKIFGKR